MKNVIILGSRGYSKLYGGWETLIHGMIDNWKDDTIKFHVFEIVNDQSKEGVFEINGISCIRIFVKQTGSVSMMIFDAKCTYYSMKYIKKYKLENPIMYYLGLRIGPLVYLKHRQIKKLGVILMENPAGLEWKRTKWNILVRWYTRVAAWFMAKSMDYLICDSEAMIDVYNKIIKSKKLIKKYISYGSYPAPILGEIPNKVKDYFNKFNLEPYNYYLDVSRFVPENNYELIVSEFLKSKTKRDLVLVTNIDKESTYFERFKKKIPFQNDKRIKFVGSMYDSEILNYLRFYARAYINGHTLGGTNPGLLESMSITDINIVFDVIFARQVGGDSVLYFDTERHLSEVISYCDQMLEEEKTCLGKLAKARIEKFYRWDFIVGQYQDLFNEVTTQKYKNEEVII